jgi:hypothetical protein
MNWNIEKYNNWLSEGEPCDYDGYDVCELYLSDSNLDILSDLGNLINLKIIHCDNNNLKSLEFLKNLVNLEVLIINNNNLKSLEFLENLVNLKVLIINNNQIDSLKSLMNLTNLIKLECHGNNLKMIDFIFDIEHLNKNCDISYDLIDSNDNDEVNDLFKKINNYEELNMMCFFNCKEPLLFGEINEIENLINQIIFLYEDIKSLFNLKNLYTYSNDLLDDNLICNDTMELLCDLENLINSLLEKIDCKDNMFNTLMYILNIIELIKYKRKIMDIAYDNINNDKYDIKDSNEYIEVNVLFKKFLDHVDINKNCIDDIGIMFQGNYVYSVLK